MLAHPKSFCSSGKVGVATRRVCALKPIIACRFDRGGERVTRIPLTWNPFKCTSQDVQCAHPWGRMQLHINHLTVLNITMIALPGNVTSPRSNASTASSRSTVATSAMSSRRPPTVQAMTITETTTIAEVTAANFHSFIEANQGPHHLVVVDFFTNW